jgi:hypothetical protein
MVIVVAAASERGSYGHDDQSFPHDPDCSAIWTMLVERDIDAFLARDWAMVEDDFIAEGFFGLHARFKPRPGDWIMPFPELPRYRDEWLRQANEMANVAYAEPLRPAIFRATDLSVIDIVGERAVARKKFNGVIARVDGGSENLDWQTLFFAPSAMTRGRLRALSAICGLW